MACVCRSFLLQDRKHRLFCMLVAMICTLSMAMWYDRSYLLISKHWRLSGCTSVACQAKIPRRYGQMMSDIDQQYLVISVGPRARGESS
jgi:hypothetical protein